MDRLIYIAMAGAQQALHQQAVTAHNLANTSTPGYKSDTAAFRVAPVVGPGMPTRAYALATIAGTNLTAGPLQRTGSDLDVAIQGDGFLAVQTPDGNEAYTRNGSLQLSSEGVLQTNGGLTVLGTGGPITVPPDSKLAIGSDGTISLTTNGQSAANVTVVGQLKLVNPARADIVKGSDGLFRTRDGQPADAAEGVTVVAGALEASNASAVSTMVEMIGLARQFDLQMKMLQNAETDSQHATQLLTTTPA
ncbi:MAG TPA: flagellar basal-body rod protein FlgF [Casimicrobiaceae bacterium]